IPAEAEGREEVKPVARSEFLRTIIGAVSFEEITCLIIVGGPEHPIFPIGFERTAPCRLFPLEQPHGRDMVVSKIPCIFQLRTVHHTARYRDITDPVGI